MRRWSFNSKYIFSNLFSTTLVFKYPFGKRNSNKAEKLFLILEFPRKLLSLKIFDGN